MAAVKQVIDKTPQQSHNSSLRPRNLAEQIYAFHFNPRQLLATYRYITVIYFAVGR
jgi:hypothetical protein